MASDVSGYAEPSRGFGTSTTLSTIVEQQQKLLHEQIKLVSGIRSRIAAYEGRALHDAALEHSVAVSEPYDFPHIAAAILTIGCTCVITFACIESKNYFRLSKTSPLDSVSFGEFVQYRLDFYFSGSPMAKPILLLSLVFIIILQASMALVTFQGYDISTAMWTTWTYVADSGTHGSAESTFEKVVGFITTIGGMIVFALMIGVITESLGNKLEGFKKGKSKAIESNHTLILGWSQKGVAIIRQLALANKDTGGRAIVVLCKEPKEEMEEMLKTAVFSKHDPLHLYGSRVIFRPGNPLAERDLMKVAAPQARSIIALSPDGMPTDAADARMVRQVLSLQQIKNMLGYFRGYTVVELQDVDNRTLVHIAGKGDVEIVVSRDLIGRLMLLSSRSPWTAIVLDCLMGYEGSNLHTKEWPQLVGQTFGAIRFRFDGAIPVGVKLADGRIVLNPPEQYELGPGDRVLALADDADSYAVNTRDVGGYAGFFKLSELQGRDKDTDMAPEKMLFCGWRRDMADMISELDYDVPPGSELWLFNNVPMEQRAVKLLDKGNKSELVLRNLTLKHAVGNPVIRRELLSIAEVSDGTRKAPATPRSAANTTKPSTAGGGGEGEGDGDVDGELSIGEPTGRREVLNFFSSISILSSYGEDAESGISGQEIDSETADNHSIATTLMIRDIQYKNLERLRLLGLPSDYSPTVSEIIEPGTRALMQYTADLNYQGFVMSSTLVASALAMVAEDRDLNRVYGELLSCQGNQIRIRKARDLVCAARGEALSFWDVSCLAKMSNEVLLGYIPFASFGLGHDTDPAPASARPGGGARGKRRGSLVAGRRPQVVLNPPDKAVPRVWHAQDRLIVIGMCRQAKRKADLRARRRRAEDDLGQLFADRVRVPIHGWLRKLNSGKENEMEDESNWRDRLCFVIDGDFAYASEKKRGETERVCALSDIRGVQAGNGWPPGFHTFRIDMGGKAVIFSAQDHADCLRWMAVLAARVPGAAAAAGAQPPRAVLAGGSAGAQVGELEQSPSPSASPAAAEQGNKEDRKRAGRQSTMTWPKTP